MERCNLSHELFFLFLRLSSSRCNHTEYQRYRRLYAMTPLHQKNKKYNILHNLLYFVVPSSCCCWCHCVFKKDHQCLNSKTLFLFKPTNFSSVFLFLLLIKMTIFFFSFNTYMCLYFFLTFKFMLIHCKVTCKCQILLLSFPWRLKIFF